MSTEESFDRATDAKNFVLLKHNTTDYSAFRSFQEEMNSRFQEIEGRRSKNERAANVRKWDSSFPPRWAGANLKDIANPAAAEAEALIRQKRFGSFYVRGEPNVGKTYLSLAIARRFIALGWVTPSQVKIISEENLLTIPKLGFSGHDRFDKLFTESLRLYIFDNVGTRESYDKRESPLWEQLLDHIYTHNLAAIFTSTGSATAFSEKLSSPAASKFRNLINGKIINMESNGRAQPIKLDELTEDELGAEKRTSDRKDLFDKFGN